MPKVYSIMESNGINRQHLPFFGYSLSEKERNTVIEQINYLLDMFQDASEYGSILNVNVCDWELLDKFVNDLNNSGQISFESVGSEETQEQLKKLFCIAKIMSQKYEVVVTNPPYMGISGGDVKLNSYVKRYYPDSKSDFFAVFIEKCGEMVKKNYYQAMITQHAWMFLSSFEKLRTKLQMVDTINMAHLGARAFEEIGGEVVQVTSFVIRKSHVTQYKGIYCRLIEPTTQKGKEEIYLAEEKRYVAVQDNFRKISGSPVAYWVSEALIKSFEYSLLYEYSVSPSQNITGNNDKYVRKHWEIEKIKVGKHDMWIFYAKGGGYRKWWGNLIDIVNWTPSARQIYQCGDGKHASQIINKEYWYKEGITWGLITSSLPSFRIMPEGATYDKGGSTIIVDENVYNFVLGLLNSKIYMNIASILNPTLNFQVKDVRTVPLILQQITKIDKLVNNAVFISKLDWDSFETSWDFTQHPLIRNAAFSIKEMQDDRNHFIEDMNYIKDAFTNWENECLLRFNQLKANEEELNRIFIDIYGLQDELTPDVEDKDITVRKADLGRDIRSFISYAVGCMFGRYSLDKEGLMFAGGNMKDIYTYYDGTFEDKDFDNVLSNGKYALADHFKIYQKRPIYWLFDSGKQNGLKALIYMHRYNEDTIGNVRVDYLHRMERTYESEINRMQDTIDNSKNSREVTVAVKRKEKLQKQLKECREYDEKIGHLALSQIKIDFDDGVKVNYEKVQTATDGRKYQVLAKI